MVAYSNTQQITLNMLRTHTNPVASARALLPSHSAVRKKHDTWYIRLSHLLVAEELCELVLRFVPKHFVIGRLYNRAVGVAGALESLRRLLGGCLLQGVDGQTKSEGTAAAMSKATTSSASNECQPRAPPIKSGGAGNGKNVNREGRDGGADTLEAIVDALSCVALFFSDTRSRLACSEMGAQGG